MAIKTGQVSFSGIGTVTAVGKRNRTTFFPTYISGVGNFTATAVSVRAALATLEGIGHVVAQGSVLSAPISTKTRIKAIQIDAETSVVGYVLTSDGAGVAAWEASGGNISGSGANKYVAFFDGPSSITGESALQWDGEILTINSGLIVNEIGADVDSRFEGDTEENLLYVNAGWDGIGIGCIGNEHYVLQIEKALAKVRVKSTTGTNHVFFTATNTAGSCSIGREASVGGTSLPGSEPYAAFLNASGSDTYPLQFGIGSQIVGTWYSDQRIGFGLVPTANMVGLSIEAGLLTLKERTTPTADVNYGKIYPKSDDKLYFQDGAGAEHELAYSGAGGGGGEMDELFLARW